MRVPTTSLYAVRVRRTRMVSAVLLSAALSLVAVVPGGAPAAAVTAVRPTLSAPTMRTGYGTVILSGTARAGARVTLYESAISINDMQPADDWQHGGGVLRVTADRHGRFRIVRYVDTGFLFAVKADRRMSAQRRVLVRVLPTIELSSTEAGAVQVHVEASPNQDGLPVRVERAGADGWITVATGVTDAVGAYDHLLTGQSPGNHEYRAFIAGDPSNGVLENHSGGAYVRVVGP